MSVDTQDADVLVVGAGPAGSTLARHLATAGRRVLVLEKGCLNFDGPVDEGIRYLHYDDDNEHEVDEELGADI